MIKAPNINTLWAQLIVEELVRNGVEYFCISSGSRSSPLTMAVANNAKACALIHFDERASAYRALGIISATNKPVAVITTSGTAAANLFPAVIETSKKKAPMIVLTADRPPELRWTGAHQTIDQTKIYGEYVRMFFDMPTPTTDIAPEFVLTTVDQAIARAQGNPGGPVHLNCMFREPLAPIKSGNIPTAYLRNISAWQKGGSPYTTYVKTQPQLNTIDVNAIASTLKSIKNGIIVVGKLSNTKESKSVVQLAQKLQWPVFADITSGLHLGNNEAIHYFDQILLSDKWRKANKPDGVLHLGGRITSKRWYEFMEEVQPKHYIMALNHLLRNDPLHNVTTRIQCSIATLTQALSKKLPKRLSNPKLSQLNTLNEVVHQSVNTFAQKQTSLNEPLVARLITQNITSSSGLFISSSMPIRDVDMYADPYQRSVPIGSNRGASGIDGVIATAAGFSTGLNKPITLLIGDLAFLYDLNALAMVQSLKNPMTIVVLNNNGGGIFSFLPIQKIGKSFEQYFGTPHHCHFDEAANLFNLNYCRPQTPGEFTQSYSIALKSNTSTIIEVQTDRNENLKVHNQLQTLIKNNLNKQLIHKRGTNHDKKYKYDRTATAVGHGRKLRRYQVR